MQKTLSKMRPDIMSVTKEKTKKNAYFNKKAKALTILASPAILLVFIFNYIPMFGLTLAFKNYRYDLGILKSPWIGFSNFVYFFTSQDAWRVTRNTIGYNAVFIALVIIGSVFVAIILNEVTSTRLVKAYQTIFFFPYFLSWPVVAILLYAFLNTDMGLVNKLIQFFGNDGVNWYSTPNAWIYIMPILNLWKNIGYNIIVFYAGLIAIDPTYYESARIDGASRLQMIFKITLPLLSPLITILLLVMLGKIFNADFGQFFIATKDTGALYPTTDVIDTYVYRTLRVTGNIGMASAVGLFQSVLGLITVLLSNWAIRAINSDNALF